MTLAGPDFLIVGAPKCGTTALHEYLQAHPDIFMAPKDQLFFGSDLSFPWPRIAARQYFDSFEGAEPARRRGEASVWYLFSRLAAQEIHAYNPEVRIIAMLRNPVDMMYSLHSQFLYGANEDIQDFAEALAAENDRCNGRRIPRTSDYPWGLQYRQVARYTEQLKRYLEVFRREQVHIILFDEFRADPQSAYRQVLEFLGVNPAFTPAMPVVNANHRVRYTRLRELSLMPPPALLRVARVVVPFRSLRRSTRRSIVLAVKRLSSSTAERDPMDPQLRARLEHEFAAEVHSLGELLGRDLLGWQAGDQARP